MKKSGNRAPEMHEEQVDTFATPFEPVVPYNKTTSGNIIGS